MKWRVRLWVDDLGSFARIAPGLRTDADAQTFEGIEVRRWPDPDIAALPSTVLPLPAEHGSLTLTEHAFAPHDIVIEAFACELPDAFISVLRMASPPVLWLNLEYLSAETWVDDCHGLASLRPDGLKKTFFFPGFTQSTGGLLREPELLQARDATQRNRQSMIDTLAGIGLTRLADALQNPHARLVNLFCYPHVPLHDILAALDRASAGDTDARFVVCAANGVAPSLEAVAASYPGIRVERIPFLAQADFDRLLWCGDLNIVRGEDSFVRAIWAARPMLWHIYPQSDDAHLAKLDAWLERYEAPECAKQAIRALNEQPDHGLVSALSESLVLPAWKAWQAQSRHWAQTLSQQPDVAENLADFWTSSLKKS